MIRATYVADVTGALVTYRVGRRVFHVFVRAVAA